jgi:hypothetical protein
MEGQDQQESGHWRCPYGVSLRPFAVIGLRHLTDGFRLVVDVRLCDSKAGAIPHCDHSKRRRFSGRYRSAAAIRRERCRTPARPMPTLDQRAESVCYHSVICQLTVDGAERRLPGLSNALSRTVSRPEVIEEGRLAPPPIDVSIRPKEIIGSLVFRVFGRLPIKVTKRANFPARSS